MSKASELSFDNSEIVIDKLLKDSYFDNQPKGKQRNDIKISWKVLESLTKTEEFLRQMENRIKSNGELEHENS